MRRSLFLCLAIALSFALVFVLNVPDGATAEKPKKQSSAGERADSRSPGAKQRKAKENTDVGMSTEPSPGKIDARSAILVEVSTGGVIFEQNADEPIEPASFTKIASLYLIFDAVKQDRIHLNDEVFVSENAWRTGGSKMFLGVGTRVPLDEIIKGIAVVSGNDACVAAAEYLSGSVDTFVDEMNRKARELGMTGTRFLTPNGLPADGQVTTARDMATLDVAYLRAFPESLKYHSSREYTYNGIHQYNRNHLLLKDPAVDGLKTGFIAASGYHLSATSKRDGMRLIAVVMGAASPAVREREALKLLNYGYRNFALVQPFQDDQPVAKARVWKGRNDEVVLYPAEAAAFLVLKNQKNQLKWETHSPDVTAPVKIGQQIGELVFMLSGQPGRTIALVSREDIPLGGWFKRSRQSVLAFLIGADWKRLGTILGGLAIVAVILLSLSGRRSQRKFAK